MSIPRPEHPRPGFYRDNWQNLNGTWEFYNDVTDSGREREVYKQDKLPDSIVVPFCPESKLSGIGNVDFMPSVWYARNVKLDKKALDGVILLHFGACDYRTTVYVNEAVAGTHTGGYTSFAVDITEFCKAGNNRIVVHAEDDLRSETQPCGKQCRTYYSCACDYTRTTGIWQTVWLEFLPVAYIADVKVNATDLSGDVKFTATLNKYAKNASLKVESFFDGKPSNSRTFALGGKVNTFALSVSPVKLWGVGEPNLYDVKYTLLIDGKATDTVQSYFGIRRIDIDGYKVRINGKSVFQRLVLDQGFYPDGIYTAPTDEDLKRDIELSMALGFNGARLHQKVFEERYLYYADRMGYIVWGEFPSWGVKISEPETLHEFLPQWLESVARDYNRPSIVGWCPYNETWDDCGGRTARNTLNSKVPHIRQQLDTNISIVYEATKAADDTRPVIDTSGNFHTDKTDIYDIHDYNQSAEIFGAVITKHGQGEYYHTHDTRQRYDGKKPYFVSEYGGIKWAGENPGANDINTAWGYGDSPQSVEEYATRLCGLTLPILDASNIFGYCYTQLTDVEQEQNGLYRYDRSKKFDDKVYARIRAALTAPAAIEKEE